MSGEAQDNWEKAIRKACMDIDPNFLSPLIEYLLKLPSFGTEGSFNLQCRLNLLSVILHEQQWKINSLLDGVLEKLKPALSHPYKIIRDCVSSVIYICFAHATGFHCTFDKGVSIAGPKPNLEELVQHVMEQLGGLEEYSGGRCGAPELTNPQIAVEATPRSLPATLEPETENPREVLPMLVESSSVEVRATPMEVDDESASIGVKNDASSTPAVIPPRSISVSDAASRRASNVDASSLQTLPCEPSGDVSEERKNAFRIMNTICVFLQGISTKVHFCVPPPLYPLLGPLCRCESVDSDVEVRNNCVSSLSVIGSTLVPRDSLRAFIERVAGVCSTQWWRSRCAALNLLQTAVFHNALTVMAEPDVRKLVSDTVLARLQDDSLEVRNVAAKVLSSLLHISFLEDTGAALRCFTRRLWPAGPSTALP